jgi:peptide/nickel transport system substrate-binding protein
LLAAQSIHPENSLNVGNVDDPHIQAELKKLDAVPSAELSHVDGQWQALERYVSRQAYIAPFGNQTLPLLFSNRVASATFNPVDYIVYASVKLR